MQISHRERRWLIIATILVLILTSLPTFTGYLAQTENQRFVGTFFDKQDYAVHLAMMNYGASGNWSYQLRFTTEKHTPAYIRTFYVYLGHASRLTNIPTAWVFQFARVLFSFLACWSIYGLIARAIPNVSARYLAFLLAIFGSGIGWLQAVFQLYPTPPISPIDLWFIDAYPFFGLALFPHFAAVIAALVYSISCALDYVTWRKKRDLLKIILLAFFVQVTNPIAFVVVDVAFAGIVLYKLYQSKKMDWNLVLSLVLVAVFQLPIFVYSIALYMVDPTWKQFNNQNITLSPHPAYYLFGFLWLWPFALIGLVRALREKNINLLWAGAWIIAAFILAYSPFFIQRRFLLAVTIPLAILGSPSLYDALKKMSLQKPSMGMIMYVFFASLSPLFLLLTYSLQNFQHPRDRFVSKDVESTAEWLGSQVTLQDVLLADEFTSQYVASRASLRVFAGHEMETIRYAEKTADVRNFYLGQFEPDWLDQTGATWVIIHQDMADLVKPALSRSWLMVFENESFQVYRRDKVK